MALWERWASAGELGSDDGGAPTMPLVRLSVVLMGWEVLDGGGECLGRGVVGRADFDVDMVAVVLARVDSVGVMSVEFRGEGRAIGRWMGWTSEIDGKGEPLVWMVGRDCLALPLLSVNLNLGSWAPALCRVLVLDFFAEVSSVDDLWKRPRKLKRDFDVDGTSDLFERKDAAAVEVRLLFGTVPLCALNSSIRSSWDEAWPRAEPSLFWRFTKSLGGVGGPVSLNGDDGPLFPVTKGTDRVLVVIGLVLSSSDEPRDGKGDGESASGFPRSGVNKPGSTISIDVSGSDAGMARAGV